MAPNQVRQAGRRDPRWSLRFRLVTIRGWGSRFDFTGYELDKDYFDAQEERFARHIAQGNLFTAPERVAAAVPLFT